MKNPTAFALSVVVVGLSTSVVVMRARQLNASTIVMMFGSLVFYAHTVNKNKIK